MHIFDLFLPGRIVSGRGRFQEIGALAADLGRRVLIVTNSHQEGRQTLDRLRAILNESGLESAVFPVESEPSTHDLDRGLDKARQRGCDMLIGLGGGSAIDTAKALSGLLTNEGAALDYMEVVGRGRKLHNPAAPWIAVPITAGTGAEVTRNAVIACKEKKVKASIRSQRLLPRIVLLDAELGVDVNQTTTACAGMDALTQLIESYTTKRANPITDALAKEGLRLVTRALRRAWENGKDVEAREEMGLAAMLSGLTLANAGLGAVHGLAAPLGGRFPAPHGAICAALLPHVMRANVDALRTTGQEDTLHRHAHIGRILAGKPELKEQEAIESGIRYCEVLTHDLAIPRLSTFQITETDLPDVVSAARKASSMQGNPVLLSDKMLTEILRKAL